MTQVQKDISPDQQKNSKGMNQDHISISYVKNSWGGKYKIPLFPSIPRDSLSSLYFSLEEQKISKALCQAQGKYLLVFC